MQPGRIPIRLRRRRRPDTLPLRLARQRIYIVPSRAGLAWTALISVMFFGALNYMNNAALLLTCELAAAMSLTMLATFRTLHRLQCQSIHCGQAIAGKVASLQLRLAADARRRNQLQARAGKGPPVRFSLAPTDGDITLTLPLQFARRGIHPLPAVELLTRWPWGLFTGWSRLNPEGQVLVWPAAETDGPPPPWRTAAQAARPGHNHTSDTPDSLRNYRPGDPPAHIAWKLLARSDEWHAKTSSAGRLPRQIELDWTQTAGLAHEARIARLARWLDVAAMQGLDYGLSLPGLRLPPARGERHYRACMDALARLP